MLKSSLKTFRISFTTDQNSKCIKAVIKLSHVECSMSDNKCAEVNWKTIVSTDPRMYINMNYWTD